MAPAHRMRTVRVDWCVMMTVALRPAVRTTVFLLYLCIGQLLFAFSEAGMSNILSEFQHDKSDTCEQ